MGSEGILVVPRYDGGRAPSSGPATTERLNEKGTPESAKYEAQLNLLPETEVRSDEHLSSASPSLQSSPDGTRVGVSLEELLIPM